jgi:dihydrofolate reductase
MEHFKESTLNGICVMGRSTYESIGKPLSNRTNIVLSRDSKYDPHPTVYVYSDIETILHEYKSYGEEEVDVFVIGGQQIYEQFLPFADIINLTVIEHKFPDADSFFPEFSLDDFKVISNVYNESDKKNKYDHSFITYKRNVINKII